MDPELNLKIPDCQLNIRVEDVAYKPRKLKTFATRPIPSAVERLGALADPEMAAKVKEADRINAKFDQAAQELKELWGPDPW